MDRERGKSLAAVVAVPHEHLIGAPGEKAIDRGVDFAGEQLPHLGIRRLGLILPADPAHTFRVSDEEDGFLLGEEGERTNKQDRQAHYAMISLIGAPLTSVRR